ncbi:MAG: hypothetical protein AAGK97_04860 [Bacteroidota bacterium]
MDHQAHDHHDHQHREEVELDYKSLHIRCNSCGSEVPANDVNIFRTIAKCQHCDNIFDFSKKEDGKEWKRRRPEMLIPEGLEVLKLRSELDIDVKWSGSMSKKGLGFLTFFALMWNGMLLPLVGGSILAGTLLPILFASIHILVGLSMLAWIAANFFNSTKVIVDKNQISVKHGPIPIINYKNQTIPTKDIKQLYVSRYVKSSTNGVPNHAYALYAIKNNGDKITLVQGMNKETQQYLEQEIELFLDIEDAPVRGETR